MMNALERWNDPTDRDAHLLVMFSIDKVYLEAKTKEQTRLFVESNGEKGSERPLWEDREFITIRIPGDVTQTAVYREVNENDKVRFAEQYKRFKANAGSQQIGTPLAEWPAMTPARIKMLEHFNIFTVEHMANAADTQVQQMGMDGVELRKLARIYLMKAQGTDAEKEKLREQLEEQARQMAEMREQMREFMAGQPAPRNKGGRPTNAERAAREAAKSEAAA
jgi:hypothetical protein